MTKDNPVPPPLDWTGLAKEALDLWQNHITSLTVDPEAKAELARMVQPMGKMFIDWTQMMQKQAPHGSGETTAAPTPASPGDSEGNSGGAANGPNDDEPVRASGANESGISGGAASDPESDRGTKPEPANTAQPEPVSSEPVFVEPILGRDSEPERDQPVSLGNEADERPETSVAPTDRDAASPSRDGDLAELAERLAELERRLDERKRISRAKHHGDSEDMVPSDSGKTATTAGR